MVYVNWNSWNEGWNVNTWPRDDNEWNAGNRVFSPDTGYEMLPRAPPEHFVWYNSRMAMRMPQRRTNRSMSGRQLLHKAMKSHKWKYLVKNGKQMSDLFGETDDQKKTITINKRLHAQKGGGHIIRNKDGRESIIGTISHELMHARHPRMREKTVRKLNRKRVKRLSTQTKKRMYDKFER